MRVAHTKYNLVTAVQTITLTRINTNVDILLGKIIVGKTTGARGRIVKYTSGVDLGNVNYDEVEVVLVEPQENLELVKNLNMVMVQKRNKFVFLLNRRNIL